VSAYRFRVAAAAISLAGCIVVVPAGMAYADCTTPGDFGAGAGCPPPDSSSGSGKTESWPPTSVDWPPQLDSSTSSDKKGGDTKPTPIVMPDGQQPPPATHSSSSDSTSTSTLPTPIVPVGPASPTVTGTTPTPIVTPHG
jgi:hypothetical protein